MYPARSRLLLCSVSGTRHSLSGFESLHMSKFLIVALALELKFLEKSGYSLFLFGITISYTSRTVYKIVVGSQALKVGIHTLETYVGHLNFYVGFPMSNIGFQCRNSNVQPRFSKAKEPTSNVILEKNSAY